MACHCSKLSCTRKRRWTAREERRGFEKDKQLTRAWDGVWGLERRTLQTNRGSEGSTRAERDPFGSRGQGITVRIGSSWISNDRPALDPEPFLSQ